MAEKETHLTFEPPRSMFGAWIGFVLLFAIFGFFVWAVIGAMPRGDEYEAKRGNARMEKMKTVREESDGIMHNYAWVDKAKGSVRMPIEHAMEMEVKDLAAKKPAAAGPIATAAPAGAQATAPDAATPAPTASPAASNAGPKPTSLGGENSEGHGQPTGSSNPPNAAPNTQPGPSATPAASPPAPSSKQPNPSAPVPTPVQTSAGTPIPLPGATP